MYLGAKLSSCSKEDRPKLELDTCSFVLCVQVSFDSLMSICCWLLLVHREKSSLNENDEVIVTSIDYIFPMLLYMLLSNNVAVYCSMWHKKCQLPTLKLSYFVEGFYILHFRILLHEEECREYCCISEKCRILKYWKQLRHLVCTF